MFALQLVSAWCLGCVVLFKNARSHDHDGCIIVSAVNQCFIVADACGTWDASVSQHFDIIKVHQAPILPNPSMQYGGAQYERDQHQRAIQETHVVHSRPYHSCMILIRSFNGIVLWDIAG